MGILQGGHMQNLESCSKEVLRGIKWLEDKIKKEEWDIYAPGYDRCETKYCSGDAGIFYPLWKVNSPLFKEYLLCIDKEEFWDTSGIYHDPHLLWYLSKMGMNCNEGFDYNIEDIIKSEQNMRGYIRSEYFDHLGPMRVLAYLDPNSKSTRMAIKYFLNNLEDFKNSRTKLALGILVLSEIDYYKYFDIIKNLCNDLIKLQNSEDYLGINENIKPELCRIPFIIHAISKVYGQNDTSIKNCIVWLKNLQDTNGSWNNRLAYTANALLALIYAGEGLKISLEDYENKKMLDIQKEQQIRPHFLCTMPPETQIKEKIKEMLNNATFRILICSRFITEFYGDIIKLKKEKPTIDIRIITVPKGENIRGDGKRFWGPAFDGLQRTLGGNFKNNVILHSRLYIIDNEVLVTSADMTSEQLEKEYNAGVWTKDEKTVKNAIEFFEKIWDESEYPKN